MSCIYFDWRNVAGLIYVLDISSVKWIGEGTDLIEEGERLALTSSRVGGAWAYVTHARHTVQLDWR